MIILLFLVFISASPIFAATNEQQAFIDGLLDESLRSHRVQACDGERVTLHCPRNTHIMVETGFYGRVVPESQLCPGRTPGKKGYDATCDVIQAQSRLSELCDKKRKCSVYVDAATFEDDPCPSTSKYLQMSYKCKPISFDGESFCAGSEMQLQCREGRRLAIYSAAYGRTTRGQAAHCAQPPRNFQKDCVRDVLPLVLGECHARSGCSLSVSDRLFGKPCHSSVQPYLNILFMCVNEEIFSEEAINGELPSLEKYKKEFAEGSGDFGDDEEWEKLSERPDAVAGHVVSSKINEPLREDVRRLDPKESKTDMFSNDAGYITEDRYSMLNQQSDGGESARAETADSQAETERIEHNAIGMSHDVMVVAQFFKENKEKVLICVGISICLALILLTLACIIHRCCGSQKTDARVRYSIERSQLLSKQSPYSVLGGPPSMTDMGDLDETFLRYSLTSPPRSAHYDF